MKKRKSILIIGPFPDPITGLSLSNEVLYKGLSINYKVDTINTSYFKFEESVGNFKLSKLIYYFLLNFKFYKIVGRDIIYITIGQSFFGILKYAFFIFFSKILGKTVVIHLHGNLLEKVYKESSKIKKKIIYLVLKKVDKGIVLSESLKSNLTPFIRNEEIHVVENFVEKQFNLS